jgi:hypothetical protein
VLSTAASVRLVQASWEDRSSGYLRGSPRLPSYGHYHHTVDRRLALGVVPVAVIQQCDRDAGREAATWDEAGGLCVMCRRSTRVGDRDATIYVVRTGAGGPQRLRTAR